MFSSRVKPGETGKAAHLYDGYSIFLIDLEKKYCSSSKT